MRRTSLCALVLSATIAADTYAEKTVVKYEAEGRRLRHQTGRRFRHDPAGGNGGWRAIVGRHGEGFPIYGPYAKRLSRRGEISAEWRMRFDRLPSGRSPWICTIEVYDATAGRHLFHRILKKKDVDHAVGRYRTFRSDKFTAPKNHRLEFRVYWWPRADIHVDWIRVVK